MRKLTPDIVQKIQRRKNEGATNHELKAEFGVSYGSVVNACQSKLKAKPKPKPSAQPEEPSQRVETLKQMLAVHRARLKISIGNEAKNGKTQTSTDRISKEVERLERLIELETAVDPQVEPVPELPRVEIQDRTEIVQLLRNSVAALDAVGQTAISAGNISGIASVQRVLNQTIAQLAKFDPPVPEKEIPPEWEAIGAAGIARMHSLLDRVLEQNGQPCKDLSSKT